MKGSEVKAAVTIIPATGMVSPVFETAEHLLVFRLCRRGLSDVSCRQSAGTEDEKSRGLAAEGVRILICGAICNETVAKLNAAGIRVFPFVSGRWDEAVKAMLANGNSFPEGYIMPGCGRHHRECCRGIRHGQ